MKRYFSMMLAVLLLLTCVLAATPMAYASTKANEPRAIAIVFDNSGSMYDDGDQAWCRATYAMEVFASMLNKGDVLQIYPMWPINVGSQTYTMEKPLQITDATQASTIRDIFTPDASGTPIESIDCAINGLKSSQIGKKYMIVLTDGGTFSKDGHGLTKEKTKDELDKRIQAQAGKSMTVMYLGIGTDACIPNTKQSDYFIKKQAVNTADVLSTLTEMCNQIFGRDTLPKNRISGNSMDFDISMSKLIVFVQGNNISDLKLTGGTVGELIGSQQTKYSTKGAGDYQSAADTSLQGMMVTYANCAAGTYNIEYTGTATSVEVYYEPDADLDFVFTDADGNNVDPNALYEGDYKVSFGMKDARTGQLIASDLLGNPNYRGSYFVNGKEVPITHDGHSGEVPVSLKMGDTFDAKLTVTYLSGYTISKDSSDFGWPQGGIKVAARPAGDLKLEITGGDELYSLQDLEEGGPYIAKVYYQGNQLTGKELESVDLKWNPDTSNAEILQEFAEDHFKLTLHYKDPDAPQDTVCGACTVSIYAYYTPQGCSEAQGECPLTYNIDDDFSPLQIDVFAPESYIVIKDLEESQPVQVALKINGAALTAEDFAAVELQVDCGGIEYTATPCEQDSSYLIKLLPTENLSEGNYQIKVTGIYTDHIGRTTQTEDAAAVTLSNIPLWLKWVIGLLLFLLLVLLIVAIMHIRVLPRRVRPDIDGCSLHVGGRDETENANFYAKLSGKQVSAYVEYNAEEIGRVSINNVVPGKESYLSKYSHKRTIYVKFPESVSVSGDITAIDIAGVGYVVNRNGDLITEDEQQSAYSISHGGVVTINGKTLVAGKEKKFNAEIPLNFKK